MDTSRIIFFGTPEFAVFGLDAILKSGRKVPLVVTQPDRPSGRGRKVTPSEVKIFAQEQELNLLQPESPKEDGFLNDLRKENVDIYVVAAYGKILPKSLLSIPKLILNIHASLLPRWRGAAPIQRAIEAGDEKTGISIMKIVPKLDAGPVLLQKEISIGPEDTSEIIFLKLALLGGEAIVEGLNLISEEKEKWTEQDENLVTYAKPLLKEEALLQFDEKAVKIHNQIRAFNPNPGSFCFGQGQRLKIWKSFVTKEDSRSEKAGRVRIQNGRLMIATQDFWLEILEGQVPGRARQDAKTMIQMLKLQESDIVFWGETADWEDSARIS